MKLLYRDLDRLPYLLALERAARERGLALELVRHQQVGSEDWGEKLKRGEVDVIGENYWALVRYRAAGDPFITVASAANGWREALLARPEITSLDDLRGRKLAARGTGPQIWFPQVILTQLGLIDEVEIVHVQERDTGRFGQWKPVAAGECAACFISRLYYDDALAAGLHEIPYPAFPFDGGHIIPTTTEEYIDTNRESVQQLVDAMFDVATTLTTVPGSLLPFTRLALDGLREYTPLTEEHEIVRLSDRLQGEIAPFPIPTLDGLRNALAIVSARFPELATFNPLLMWDLSFARTALRTRTLSR